MPRFEERRRNYYIKKRFQRDFIVKFCLLVAAGSVISAAIVYYMSTTTLTTTFENSRLTIKSTADFILPTVLLAGIIVTVLVGLAAIGLTLFASHKIAGPLYRIDKDIQEVSSGNLNVKFNLRQGDEIRPIAVSLNILLHNLKEAVSDIKRSAYSLESAVEQFEKDRQDMALLEVKNKLRQLKSTLDRLKT